MNRGILYLIVSISGAAVLALEILGTRLLGPFFGVGLFLWSALISTALAALSFGYWLGGRYADGGPSGRRLALLLGGAGIYVLLLPAMKSPLIVATDGLELRAAILSVSGLLFFPPLALLGGVTPMAVRLAASDVDRIGRTTGELFAISTLASVLAALATGFVLIPWLGTSRLLLAIGSALIAAAILARLALGGSRDDGRSARREVGVMLGITALVIAPMVEAERLPDGVLAKVSSPYAELRVVEHDQQRELLIDGGIHTLVRASDLAPRQAYLMAAELALDCFPDRGDVLLIGLGGGAAARLFAERGWRVTAVEIDPSVPPLAERYFGWSPDSTELHIEDGRRHLQRSRERYDFILMDAFGSSSIPFHLVTQECFAEAKARLEQGGILALNIETVGWADPLARALASTLRTSFHDVIALPTVEPPDRLGNIILLASDRELHLRPDQLGDPVEALTDVQRHWRVVQRLHAWNNRFDPQPGRILTDDWNPVEIPAERINRVARKELRKLVPLRLLAG